MGARQLNIVVAERNRLVAEAIRDVFLEIAGDAEVSIADSLAAAVGIARRSSLDLIVADMWIGGYSLEETLRQLKEWSPSAEIMVTSSHVDADLRRRVSRAGAMGCIEREQILGKAAGILEQLGA